MNTRLKLGLAVLLSTVLMACGGGSPVTPPDDGLTTAYDVHDDQPDDLSDPNSGSTLLTPEVDPNSSLGLPRLIGIKPKLQLDTQVMSNKLAATITDLQVLNTANCAPNLTTRESCQFRFNLPTVPQRLKVGAVLVAGVTPATPNGLLVRVTAIQGQSILAREAALGEALKEGEFQGERSFSPSQITSQTLLPGMTPVTISAQDLRAQGLKAQGLGFRYALNHVQLLPGLHADGLIEFDASCGAEAGLTWRKKYGIPIYPNGVSFEAKCGVEQASQLKLTAGASLAVSVGIPIGSITLEPIVFSVGPVPVVLVPKISLAVNAAGKVTANMTFSADQHFTAKVGIGYSSGFKPYQEFSSGSDTQLGHVEASLEVEASANLKQSLLLYGVIGPQMTESAYLTFKGDLVPNPNWCMTVGLRADLYLHIDLYIKTLDYGPANLFDAEISKRCETNHPPTISITPVTALDANHTIQLFNQQALVTLLPNANDTEDGTALSVVWSSDRDGALGITSNGMPATLTLHTLGQHVLTALVTDNGGLKATATFTVNVVQPPTTTLSASEILAKTTPTGAILPDQSWVGYGDVIDLSVASNLSQFGILTSFLWTVTLPDGTKTTLALPPNVVAESDTSTRTWKVPTLAAEGPITIQVTGTAKNPGQPAVSFTRTIHFTAGYREP